ncbi:hypothetical protein GUITHDRAFT_41877, partial [Guillardia theta CCMP2712]
LTEALVLERTRAEQLSSVRNLNLWGSNLEDVSILKQMPNVEVLSLSVNRIRTLSDFRHCLKLSELYLRKNEIVDLNELRQLQHLKNLSVLWLCDNPCVGDCIATYRAQTIAMLPNITKLDNIDVTEEERREASETY